MLDVSCDARRVLALAFLFTFLPIAAWAADLRVTDAWIRLLPGAAPAGGYFVLHNGTAQPAVLVGAASDAFGQVMMHKTTEERGVTRMVHLERIDVAAGGKLAFAPGGYHLMLMQPSRKFSAGERIRFTLEFAGGRKLAAHFEVRGPAGK